MIEDAGSTPDDNFPKGTGRPATRALRAAGYRTLDDLAGESEDALRKLHGVGPKAVDVVKAALKERGLGLRP